jgi:hypothetical protein
LLLIVNIDPPWQKIIAGQQQARECVVDRDTSRVMSWNGENLKGATAEVERRNSFGPIVKAEEHLHLRLLIPYYFHVLVPEELIVPAAVIKVTVGVCDDQRKSGLPLLCEETKDCARYWRGVDGSGVKQEGARLANQEVHERRFKISARALAKNVRHRIVLVNLDCRVIALGAVR